MGFWRTQEDEGITIHLALGAGSEKVRKQAGLVCADCVFRLSGICTSMIAAPTTRAGTDRPEITASILTQNGEPIGTAPVRVLFRPDTIRHAQQAAYTLTQAVSLLDISRSTLGNWITWARERGATVAAQTDDADGRLHILTAEQLTEIVGPHERRLGASALAFFEGVRFQAIAAAHGTGGEPPASLWATAGAGCSNESLNLHMRSSGQSELTYAGTAHCDAPQVAPEPSGY